MPSARWARSTCLEVEHQREVQDVVMKCTNRPSNGPPRYKRGWLCVRYEHDPGAEATSRKQKRELVPYNVETARLRVDPLPQGRTDLTELEIVRRVHLHQLHELKCRVGKKSIFPERKARALGHPTVPLVEDPGEESLKRLMKRAEVGMVEKTCFCLIRQFINLHFLHRVD